MTRADELQSSEVGGFCSSFRHLLCLKRAQEISIDELGLGAVDLAWNPVRQSAESIFNWIRMDFGVQEHSMLQVMVHWPMPGKHVAAYLALEDAYQFVDRVWRGAVVSCRSWCGVVKQKH